MARLYVDGSSKIVWGERLDGQKLFRDIPIADFNISGKQANEAGLSATTEARRYAKSHEIAEQLHNLLLFVASAEELESQHSKSYEQLIKIFQNSIDLLREASYQIEDKIVQALETLTAEFKKLSTEPNNPAGKEANKEAPNTTSTPTDISTDKPKRGRPKSKPTQQ